MPLPETRGSHLASERERKRAIRRLRKLERKKREKEQMQNGNTKNGSHLREVSATPTPSQNGAGGGPTGNPRRCGKVFPLHKRDVILGYVHRNGKEATTSTLCKLVPTKARLSHTSMVSDLLREPEHRWSSTGIAILDRLFQYLSGEQQALPLQAPANIPPVASRAAQQTAIVPRAASAPQFDIGLLAQVISQSVASAVVAAFGNAAVSAPPQLQEHAIKSFEQMNVTEQRGIINSQHARYAEHLRLNCGILTGEFAAAWRRSYDAYDRETGADCQSRAAAQCVKPLDIIQGDNDLVRFWQITRRTWES